MDNLGNINMHRRLNYFMVDDNWNAFYFALHMLLNPIKVSCRAEQIHVLKVFWTPEIPGT